MVQLNKAMQPHSALHFFDPSSGILYQIFHYKVHLIRQKSSFYHLQRSQVLSTVNAMQTAGFKFPGSQGSQRKYYEPIHTVSAVAQEIITPFTESRNSLREVQRQHKTRQQYSVAGISAKFTAR